MKGQVYRLTCLHDAKGEGLRCVMMLNSLMMFQTTMIVGGRWGYSLQVNFEMGEVIHCSV